MLKYGIIAKSIELMCFSPALKKLSALKPEMNMTECKKKVKNEFYNTYTEC